MKGEAKEEETGRQRQGLCDVGPSAGGYGRVLETGEVKCGRGMSREAALLDCFLHSIRKALGLNVEGNTLSTCDSDLSWR